MTKRGMSSVTGNLAGTDWQVVHGELKLTADANDVAAVKIGEWRPDHHYLFGGQEEASPAAYAAIPWQNTFFLSACDGTIVNLVAPLPRSVIDYGGGSMATSVANRSVYPGMKGTGSVNELVVFLTTDYGVNIFDFEVKFLSNGDITKQWLGFGNGNDDYMFLVARSIL